MKMTEAIQMRRRSIAITFSRMQNGKATLVARNLEVAQFCQAQVLYA